jgi:hypothetical protein|tara:strand:+ start:989 stop:1153 length:165 start_codon:yes stop_codon:yes gene_type:complete
MGMAFNTGMMGLIMRVSGATIRLKAKELFGMLKEMYTKVNSKTTWPMAMVSTHI